MTYKDEVLLDNPTGYWKFDETSGTVLDSSGNGIDRTGTDLQQGVTGQVDLAARFNGSSSNVNLGNTSLLRFNKSLTIEHWVHVDDPWAGSATLATVFSDGANNYRTLIYDDYTFALLIRDGGGSLKVSRSTNSIPTNTWVHLVATYNGDTGDYALYVDGQLFHSEATALRNMGTSTENKHIGTYDGSIHHYGGVLDEVAVYGHVLSPARIEAHYSAASETSVDIDVAAPTAASQSQAHASNLTVEQSVSIAAPLASASGASPIPAVSTGLRVDAVASTGTASAPKPTVSIGAVANAPTSQSSSQALTPDVQAQRNVSLSPLVVNSFAQAAPPTMSTGVTTIVSAAGSNASALAPAVAVQSNAVIDTPSASAAGQAVVPTVIAGRNASIEAPLAASSGQAKPGEVYATKVLTLTPTLQMGVITFSNGKQWTASDRLGEVNDRPYDQLFEIDSLKNKGIIDARVTLIGGSIQGAGSLNVDVASIDADWDGTGDIPPYEDYVGETKDLSAFGDTVWDITQLAKDWGLLARAQYGFALRHVSGTPNIRDYTIEVRVEYEEIDSVPNVLEEAPTTNSTSQAHAPTVSVLAGAFVEAPVGTSVGTASAPLFSTGATLDAPTAGSGAGAHSPSLNVGANQNAPTESSTASAGLPNVTTVMSIDAATSSSNAAAHAPNATAIKNPSVAAPVAAGNSKALVPRVRISKTVEALTGISSASAGIPGLTVGVTLQAPVTDSASEALAPTLPNSNVRVPAATSQAAALRPLYADALPDAQVALITGGNDSDVDTADNESAVDVGGSEGTVNAAGHEAVLYLHTQQ